MGELKIGTSGYSYQDWRGVFYPKHLEAKDFLRHYASFFDCVEIDSTYYRIPSPYVLEALTKKVPAGFQFTVKTPSTFTHERDKFGEMIETFRRATAPLIRKRMLGCYVAQFPYSFPPGKEGLKHIAMIADALDAHVCVEFRRREWQDERVYEYLRAKGIGFVNVDTPKFKSLPRPSSVVTADVGYVRFHGRNAAKWWSHEQVHERYDYTYSQEELEEWVPRIEEMRDKAKRTFVMFNNHFRGQAIKGANDLKTLLGLPAEGAGQSTLKG